MQPYPPAPSHVWPRHLHGAGCLSAWAMDTGFPTVVWCLFLGLGFAVFLPLLAGVFGVCACVRALGSPHHSWLGFVVCAIGLGFRLAPRHSWLGLSGLCGCVRAPPDSHHSRLGFAVWLCVLGLGFQLRPATPVSGVRVCVCLSVRSACTPPVMAGMCGVCVCAWAQILAAPRHPCLGCVCVLFVCVLRLYSATSGWGVLCGCVCLSSGLSCALPLLAGVFGCVCACVRAPLVPRQSWLGCAVSVCVLVLGLGFQLRPATPGWGFRVCVCLCARSACTTPLLAWVCGGGVWGRPRVSAAHRHSWLGCWGVCVFMRALSLYPATPGWSVLCGCVCLGSGFGCGPALLAGVLGCVCVCVRAPFVPRHSCLACAVWLCVLVLGLGLQLRPATPGWGVGICVCLCACSVCTPPLLAGVCGLGVCACARVSAAPCHSWLGCWGVYLFVCTLRLYPAYPAWGARLGCVCLGFGFGCAPPLLAGLLVSVCLPLRTPPVPCHSWLVCAMLVYVLGLGFRLRPANSGWGVRVCVCLSARSACSPPLLAWLCGVAVCACTRLSCCAPALLAGVWVMCVGVHPLLVPRHSWLWSVVCGLGCASPLFLNRGLWRVVLALQVCGTRWPLLLGTCPCASVVAGSVLRPASWPRVGAPRLVRSGLSRCSGRRSRCLGVFPHPRGLRPRTKWADAWGTWRPAENRVSCACRWPLPRQRRWARSASYPFVAPRWGCPWRVPPASVLGCLGCGGLRVWTQSLTRLVSRTARLSTGDSAGAPGQFYVDADTAPFRSEDATPWSLACVRVRAPFAVSGRPASRAPFGAPHLFLWPVSVCSLFARPLLGWVCPICGCCCFFFFPFLLCAPVVSGIPCFPARSALGRGVVFCPVVGSRVVFPPPPPPRALCAFSFGCVLVVLPLPPARCGALCYALSCIVWCGAAVCGVLCVFTGAVWCACVGLGSCALLSGAVLCLVLLCCFCCVLQSCATVFSACLFLALFLAFLWCSGLFLSVCCSARMRPAVRRGPVASPSCAGLCCGVLFGALLCRRASLGSVLCFLFHCGAWVATCLVRCCGGLLCSVCP